METPPTCGVILSDKTSLCGLPAIAIISVANPDDQSKVMDGVRVCQDHSDRLFNDGVAFAFESLSGKKLMLQLKTEAIPDKLDTSQP